jgi:2-keto-4-pentenoate hydratase/2-oxohepta-3-ene-1,7-dioic acid hydratase in catechol pathway
MRIGRFADTDNSRFWGLIDSDAETVQRIAGEIDSWADFAAAEDHRRLPLTGDKEQMTPYRLLEPVDPRGRVLGVGANYLAHLQRLGVSEPPARPNAFIKPNSALVAPGAEIRYPPTTAQLDYEVELVVAMAGPTSVLGYTIGNDVSARDAKALGGIDLFGMKALDATSPVGPWIVTPAEAGTAAQPELDIALRVNGEERQRDNTRAMVFSIAKILDYLNDRVELRCGDVVFTGTTAGVGLEDGRFLQPGDIVEAEIERIGILRNTIGNRR